MRVSPPSRKHFEASEMKLSPSKPVLSSSSLHILAPEVWRRAKIRWQHYYSISRWCQSYTYMKPCLLMTFSRSKWWIFWFWSLNGKHCWHTGFCWSLWNLTLQMLLMTVNIFLSFTDTSMPVIRTLSKVAKQALLSTPGCGCQPLTMAVRNISFSPRQVTSDASFHSVSFSETDHPKVLITGMQQLIILM